MKIDFRVDYIAQTAAYFTRFPQTEQSEKILAEIKSDLIDRARSVRQDTGSRAWNKALQQMKGRLLNISV